ncbi:MAG: cytochrome C [Nitrospirae bacterium]|nr:cytochrome C [Nitrospirota bacterium]MCL5285563.1 cytochrome C [Nitrospirota bacterium]
MRSGYSALLPLWLAGAITATLTGGPARAAEPPGMALLKTRCASCHNLTGPAPASLHTLWARKGPDMFYAGNKYRKSWLVSWLRHPVRIRPAGMFYADHIKPGPKRDMIDESTLKPHMALSAADAKLAAEALMTLRAHDDLIAREKVPPGSISKTMGALVFDKFLGCIACHRIEPDYGGLSGPELFTAGDRLRSRFMASYIRSPQAWDPKIWMPNKHVSDSRIIQLVHYLQSLSKGVSHG